MSEIIEQAIYALHAYTPLLPAVKTGHPQFVIKTTLVAVDVVCYKDTIF